MADASLDELLARLSVEMGRVDERAYRSYGAPASEHALSALAAVFPDQEIPAEIQSWFRWHDGAGKELPSFDPSSNWVMMSIEASLSTRDFLASPASDGSDHSLDWLPLLQNYAGDYLSYVMRGEKRGRLVEYRHDRRGRPVRHPSLHALVEPALRQWASLPVREIVELERIGEWTRIDPSDLDVTTLPVESAVVFCTLSMGARVYWRIYVHVEPGRWVWGSAGEEPWEPDALFRAAQGVVDKESRSTDDMVTAFKFQLDDLEHALTAPPSHAPKDLRALGVFLGTVRRTR